MSEDGGTHRLSTEGADQLSLAGVNGPAINVLVATFALFMPLLALQAMLAFR